MKFHDIYSLFERDIAPARRDVDQCIFDAKEELARRAAYLRRLIDTGDRLSASNDRDFLSQKGLLLIEETDRGLAVIKEVAGDGDRYSWTPRKGLHICLAGEIDCVSHDIICDFPNEPSHMPQLGKPHDARMPAGSFLYHGARTATSFQSTAATPAVLLSIYGNPAHYLDWVFDRAGHASLVTLGVTKYSVQERALDTYIRLMGEGAVEANIDRLFPFARSECHIVRHKALQALWQTGGADAFVLDRSRNDDHSEIRALAEQLAEMGA